MRTEELKLTLQKNHDTVHQQIIDLSPAQNRISRLVSRAVVRCTYFPLA